MERVIAYASHTSSKSESRYDAYKLELLTLQWVICDQFHKYLCREEFNVYTDNNPLIYILTTTRLNAIGQRWVADLAKYNFQLHYQSGKLNRHADTLSRIPQDRDGNLTTMDPVIIQGSITGRCAKLLCSPRIL